MRAAKVLFKVSWTDKHGKRLSEPQELVVSVDSSACSRLIVCSARNGRIDVMDSLKSMYLDPKGLLSASWAAATSLTSSHADFLLDGDERKDKTCEIWAHGVLLSLLRRQINNVAKNEERVLNFDAVDIGVAMGKMLASISQSSKNLAYKMTRDERLRFFAMLGQAVQCFQVSISSKSEKLLDEEEMSLRLSKLQKIPNAIWEIFATEGFLYSAGDLETNKDTLTCWNEQRITSSYVQRGLRFMMDLSFRARNYRFVRATPALMYWNVSKIPIGPLPLTSMDIQISSAAFQNEARNVMEMCLNRRGSQIDPSVTLQVEALLVNAPSLSSLRELLNRVIESGRLDVS